MASCANLGSNEALARDNEINKITLDPVLPALGGPGPLINPLPSRSAAMNTVATAIANLVPGHSSMGDRPAYTRHSVHSHGA